MTASTSNRDRSCGTCRHFADDAAGLERAIPGLNILSSAYGSVRDETGLCTRHETFVTPSAGCADFAGIAAKPDQQRAG
jgi:hypothetical protein